MEALITSYGLDFKSFNDLLVKRNAIIAGSSVLSVYLDNAFEANDIDVWIPCSKSLKEFLPIYKDLFKYFSKIGYDDDEINKTEVTNERSRYTNLPTGRASIIKVLEFHNVDHKKIQFVFVDMHPEDFIKETFDLSVCMTWYNPKTQTIKTYDEYYTKDMKMYINYEKEIKDLHPKNQARIEKYIARGFELIPKPLPILKTRDERIFTKDFKIEANDVIYLGDVNICDYLEESKKNIILKVSKSYYAYNRDDLVREFERCRVRDYTLTPMKQAIPITYIDHFKYDDYSIYDIKITTFKSSDKKHTIHNVRPMTVKQFEAIYNENGIKEGLVKKFHNNGIIKSETFYSEGCKNGIKKNYNKSGELIGETPYVNDKIEGIRKFYHNGKIRKTQSFSDNKLNGPTLIYLFDRYKTTIHIECNYLNDQLHGQYVEYDEHGNITFKIKYVNDNPVLPSKL
jgi:antitoxin component YwqK of YwqJK toxin-antitoxin module